VSNDYSLEDVEAMQAQLEALEVPPNINPRLLALWIEREEEEIERRRRKFVKPPRKFGRSLNRLFAAYIGIAIMCLAIVLGLIQGQEPTTTLKTACVVFLIYSIIGAFVGMIAERCVNDSVETVLRDIVGKSRGTESPNGDTESQS
jgi:hypothetical protein